MSEVVHLSTDVLRELSGEASRLAALIARLAETAALAEPGAEIPVAALRAIIRARRLRSDFFPADLFADPAWDMLLALKVAELESHRLTVSSLCAAAAVPSTTALRWISVLCDRGLVVRREDKEDRRRVFLELSPEVAKAMTTYLRAALQLTRGC